MKIKLFILILLVNKLLYGEPSSYQYSDFYDKFRKPMAKLNENFPKGISYSLYTSEKYLKPFAANTKENVQDFYNKYNDIPYRIQELLKEVFNKAIFFENKRLKYSKMILQLTGNGKDIADSIASEDVGSFILNMLSTSIDNSSIDNQEQELRNSLKELAVSMEKLDNAIKLKF